jgi:peptide/nickel transport system permease protein
MFMLKYIGKRLLMMIPVIIGVIFIIFTIMELTPGDPVMMILGEGAPMEAQEALREEMGLNNPVLVRFAQYVIGAFQGDLGTSYTSNLPVFDEIMSRMPYTLSLATFSICVAVIVGLPIGILSAIKQYSLTDNMTLAISLTITSMPAFFLAMLLMMIFCIKLGWLPMMGLSSPKHYILPVIASASSTTAALLRMTRTTMLEVIRQDYIRTAKAKGATPRGVTYGHALRNALLPVVTVIGTNFGFALGGSIVLEQVFTIPGLGQLMINAIRQKDTPIVMGAVMTTAIFASLINLLVDIIYTYIDPRLASQFTSVKRQVKKA